MNGINTKLKSRLIFIHSLILVLKRSGEKQLSLSPVLKLNPKKTNENKTN